MLDENRRPDGLDLEQGNLLERRQATMRRRRWWRKSNALERWSRERRARSRGGHLLERRLAAMRRRWWSRNRMNPKHYCNREREL
ncbi:hypothetical protein MRB53_009681 [Persea americana]|uniref:Uncharacterized protein n=1 Tax=Persea americana TaxID=3435 RepID=A0ACC2LQV6_PERAE|nr:hypothetical protein MRB53_009681 [Persea americana]